MQKCKVLLVRYWLHLFHLVPVFQRHGLLAHRDHGSNQSGQLVRVFSLVMAIVAVVIVQGSSYKLHLNRLFPGRLEVDTVVRGSVLLDERVVSRRNWYLLLTSASNKRYPETPLTLKHKWYLTWPQVAIGKSCKKMRAPNFFHVASCLTCWMGERRGRGMGVGHGWTGQAMDTRGAQAHSLIAAVRPQIPD